MIPHILRLSSKKESGPKKAASGATKALGAVQKEVIAFLAAIVSLEQSIGDRVMKKKKSEPHVPIEEPR